MVELTTRLIQLSGNVYYQALAIPASAVADLFADERDRRVVVTVNGDFSWQGALMPDGQGDYFINVNKEVREKTGITLHDTVTLTLEKDESPYGMPLPAEVAELWAMDPEARDLFHRLTPGKQRALLYQIGKPKTSSTRARKAVQIMEYLKTTGGKLDFRALNAYIKADNARW